MRKFILSLLVFGASSLALANTNDANDILKLFDVTTSATECSHTTGECPGVGWFCLNGRCVQEHTGERCWNDIDCPIGGHCISGVCR